MPSDLETLRRWATPAQAKYLSAVEKHGTHTKAAKALGVGRRTVDRALQRLRDRAAADGWSPEHDQTHPAAPGQKLRGVSTLYDAEGRVVQQWVKTKADRDQLEVIYREVVESLSESIKREKPTKPPKSTDTDLLNLYVVTDFHLGMYAWGDETGDDWDLNIAEDLLVRWFETAIRQAPASGTAVLAQLGDFLHTDGLRSVTPESGNLLDSDTRFAKLVRVAIRALRRVVRLLLEKHEIVHLVLAEGNHDPSSSVWLREWFAALYEDEPRVTVDLNPDPYYCVEHGSTSLFLHHGHKRGLKDVDDVFVAKFREVFGRTKHSYGHIGHFHHAASAESNLMIVEQHRTLASSDAYASRGGWVSGRGASVITYHREHGEVGRVTVAPEMCADGAA